MVFVRISAMRVSAMARNARPARVFRSGELQPWHRAVQRRAYASGHGSTGPVKTSDVPWAAASVVGTAAGLYFVLNQDLGHGDEHHDAHEKHDDEDHAEADSKDDSKDEPKEDEKDDSKDSDDEKSEKKDENTEEAPDKSDKADPRKEAKSWNETSGKQQGMSNDDTHHSSQIDKQDEKSKKGEGVADTAKLKGTVSTNRPPAENKEERGKEQVDKDK